MKKILAILLVVLMLGTTTAFADSAKVFSLTDPVVSLTADGETQTIDLTGLRLDFGVIGEEEPVIGLNVYGGEELLFVATLKVTGENVLLGIEGVDGTYYVPSAMGTVNASQLDLSVVDTDALITTVMNAIEFRDDGSFTVPYTALNDVTEQLLPVLEQVEIEGLDTAEFAEAFAQYKEAGNGVNIEGFVTPTASGIDAEANYYVVTNGEASASPMLTVKGSMIPGDSSTDVNAEVLVADEDTGAMTSVLTAAINVGDTSAVSLNIMGEVNAYFHYDPSLQLVTLGGDAEGVAAELNCTVGVSDGEITLCEVGSVDGAVNLQEMTDEEANAFLGQLMGAASGLIGFVMPALSSVLG